MLLGKKNLGRKFVLAKFYFGLIRFDCVMLTITSKLNNNNTEFGGAGCVKIVLQTNNRVKPTSTWLWLSWVLTTRTSKQARRLQGRARVKSVVTHRFCTCVSYETSFAQMER